MRKYTKFNNKHKAFIYLSKSSLRRKTPTASGRAYSICPTRGYSTPGGGCSRSTHETFSGSQNLSLQNQAEIEEVIGERKHPRLAAAVNKKKLNREEKGRRGEETKNYYLSHIWWLLLSEKLIGDVSTFFP